MSARIANSFSLEDCIWWVVDGTRETATTERRSTAVGGVRCVEGNTNGDSAQQDTGCAARCQCQ